MSVVNIHKLQTCKLVSHITGCSAALITPLSFQKELQPFLSVLSASGTPFS